MLVAARHRHSCTASQVGLDERVYEKGVEVTDDQLAAANIVRDAFHGDWHYTVTPPVASSSTLISPCVRSLDA